MHVNPRRAGATFYRYSALATPSAWLVSAIRDVARAFPAVKQLFEAPEQFTVEAVYILLRRSGKNHSLKIIPEVGSGGSAPGCQRQAQGQTALYGIRLLYLQRIQSNLRHALLRFFQAWAFAGKQLPIGKGYGNSEDFGMFRPVATYQGIYRPFL